VSESLPTVSVIIPTRPGQSEIAAVAAARKLDYPKDKLEIIVARGRQPSVQRNAAIKKAAGEIIYFLDDDSVPLPGNLRRAITHFANPDVKMVGGPNVCPPNAPLIEQRFALTMGNWLAFGPSRARYIPVGTSRESGEKELILCNLLARRDTLTELGGFNESLYPNEENALMDEIQKRGGKLIYDPELFIFRRPRPTFAAFTKMLMTYGRGRAEQFRLHPTIGSAANFVPPLFCLFLLGCAGMPFFDPLIARIYEGILVFYCLVVYFSAFASYASCVTRGKGNIRPGTSFVVAFLIFWTHVMYGLGFWRGLFTSPKPPPQEISSEVTVEKMTH